MKLSIIVPVYNVELYLERCVSSLVNQTYQDIEILLINDGSTDNSLTVCKKLIKRDDRIHLIDQTNQGLSGARNTGLDYASGELIAFIDSDDWVHPLMFSEMIFFLQEKNLKIVECELIKKEGKEIVDIQFDRSKVRREVFDSDTMLYNCLKNQLYSVCIKIFTKEIAKNQRFKIGKISEDVYYTYDSFKIVNQIGKIFFPFYNYFVLNTTSITKGKYSLKTLQSIEASLFILRDINQSAWSEKVKGQALASLKAPLIYNYKMISKSGYIENRTIHLKKIKKQVSQYFGLKQIVKDFNLFLIYFIPIPIYQSLMNLYSLRKQYE